MARKQETILIVGGAGYIGSHMVKTLVHHGYDVLILDNLSTGYRRLVIGEMHDPESHLIPIILNSALNGSAIKIFGTDYPTDDGTCIRDYVHVTDLANAHLAAMEALMDGSESRTYNLGNSIGYSVREVIDLSEKVVGKKIRVIEDSRRPGDPAVLVASAKKKYT